jgi:hypothetical protein
VAKKVEKSNKGKKDEDKKKVTVEKKEKEVKRQVKVE